MLAREAEQLRGFVDLVTHPWVTAVCEAVLGPQYEIVELGFDVPLAGAVNQPWPGRGDADTDYSEAHDRGTGHGRELSPAGVDT